MEFQELFNLTVGATGFLIGWLLNTMWNSIKDMQSADKELAAKVASIEVLVAGNYMPRAEYSADMTKISESLYRIEAKLDRKVDKE